MTLLLGPRGSVVQRRQDTPIGRASPARKNQDVTMKTIRALARFAFDLLTAPF